MLILSLYYVMCTSGVLFGRVSWDFCSYFSLKVSLTLLVTGFFQCSVPDILYIYIAFQHSFGKFSLWLGTAVSNIISRPWH